MQDSIATALPSHELLIHGPSKYLPSAQPTRNQFSPKPSCPIRFLINPEHRSQATKAKKNIAAPSPIVPAALAMRGIPAQVQSSQAYRSSGFEVRATCWPKIRSSHHWHAQHFSSLLQERESAVSPFLPIFPDVPPNAFAFRTASGSCCCSCSPNTRFHLPLEKT